MESYSEKLKNFEKALTRLQESIEEYNQTHSDTVRDGVIQRFEFTCELSWKTTREFLLDQGYSEINSPKAVMREAYSYGLIKDDQEWIHLLNDRNLTAHLYDEKAAAEIYHRIVSHHVGCFAQLLEQLKNKKSRPPCVNTKSGVQNPHTATYKSLHGYYTTISVRRKEAQNE